MKRDNTKSKYIKIISFFVFLSILLCAATIISSVKAEKYRRQEAAASERALSELCENLDNITVMLQKGIYSGGTKMLSSVSTQLIRSSSGAKVSLGVLTEKDMETDDIYKFLSQVGDFTSSLVEKLQSGGSLTSEERAAMNKLYKYSQSLSEGLGAVRDGYFDGTVSFEKSLSELSVGEENETVLFSDSVQDTKQSLADYPTLIYDGPFADNVLERDGVFLKDKSKITAQQAKKLAAKYLNVQVSSLRQESDENSALELYCFASGDKSIGITKQGGYLCYITNPDFSGEIAISGKEAVKKATDYLEKIGYKSMKNSYYSIYDGICTINFAYSENDIIYYADLIKVSVALDSANVTAVDARGYLMNHCQRKLEHEKVDIDEAKKNLSPELSLMSTAKALIPTKDGTEKLCYEFHCADSQKQEVLVYTDVQTGDEEDVLLLLYTDGGVLTR